MNRRLYRSDEDRVIAGVAGGMAETYDLDPALVRIGWVVLALLTGGMIVIVYIAMALVVPLADDQSLPAGQGATWPSSVPPVPAAPPPQPSEGDPTTADDMAQAGDANIEGSTSQMLTPPLYMSEREARRARRRERRASSDLSGPLVFGLLLILVGAFFLVRDYLPAIAWGQVWPIVLIAIGVVLLLAALRRTGR